MEKETKAKVIKFILICAIILGIVAFILNIVYAFKSQNREANIYTAISGWVSGISTIILGVIAFYVNSKYKKDEDERTWKNYYIEHMENYKKNIIDIYNEFKQTNYTELLKRLTQKEFDCSPALLLKIEEESINLKIVNALFALGFCKFHVDMRDKLYNNYSTYMQKLIYIINNVTAVSTEQLTDIIIETSNLYKETMLCFKLHLVHIDIFVSNIILRKTKNELIDILNEHSEQQLAWWSDKEKMLKLEQDN